MADGFKIASAWVEVTPDTTGFKEKLDAAIDKDKVTAKVGVSIDQSKLGTLKSDLDKASGDAGSSSSESFASKFIGGTTFGKSGAIVTAVGSAMALLPALGALGGVEMVAAIGVSIAAKLPSVQAAFKSFGTQVMGTLQAAVKPMVPVILSLLTQIAGFIKQIEPLLSDMFKTVTPMLAPLVNGFESLIKGILPGFIALLKAASPAVNALSGILGTLGKDIGGMLSAMAPAISASAKVLTVLADAVGGILPIVGKLAAVFASALAPVLTVLMNAFKALEPSITLFAKVLASLAGAVLTSISGLLQALGKVIIAIAPSVAKLADSFKQAFNTLENTGVIFELEDALETLAKPLGNLIVALVNALVPVLPQVISLIGELAGMFTQEFVDVIAGIAIALTAMIKAIPPGVLTLIVEAVVTLVAGMKALSIILPVVKAAFAALDIEMDANPFSIIALAVIALAAIVIKYHQQILTAIETAWNTIFSFLKTVWNAIVTLFENWTLLGLIIKYHQQILNAITTAWNAIYNFFVTIINKVTAFFTTAWNTIFSGIKTAWTTISGWFTTWWNTEYNFFSQAISKITSFLVTAWNTITSNVKSAWSAITSFFSSWWSALSSAFSSALSKVENTLSSGWNTITSAVKSAWNTITSLFSSVWSTIESDVSNGFSKVEGAFTAGVTAIKNIWTRLEQDLKTPWDWIVTNVFDNIAKVWNDIPGLPTIHLSEGGPVPGSGTGDTVPALLTPGERVLSVDQVGQLGGHGAIDKMVGRGTGGPVRYGGGGILGDLTGDIKKGLDSLEGLTEHAAADILKRTLNFAGIGNSQVAKDMEGIPTAAVTGLVTSLAHLFTGSGGTGGGGGGGGPIPKGGLGPANLRQIEDWWMGAGGPGGATAHIAAAITGAESGFNVKIVQQGQPYARTGWGLWQITPGDSEPQAGINEALLTGPTNAEAAVAKYRGADGGGDNFTPWTTYNDGAYRQFLDNGGLIMPGVNHIVNNTGAPERVLSNNPNAGGISVNFYGTQYPTPEQIAALKIQIASAVGVAG